MPRKTLKLPKLGRRFGRPDVERCDIFIDSGFLDWGKYTGKPPIFNESASKGVQMLSSVPSGGKKRCGIQGESGYFEKKFYTIFVKDPYIEKWKIIGRPPLKPINGPWIPSGSAKLHSTPNDNYGTFTKNSEMPAFSPLTKPVKNEKSFINFLTSPGKKGNSGYVDICINKYPSHDYNNESDPYILPELIFSKNWKEHKAKILNGPMKAGFYPQPYFDNNPFRDPIMKPTYVEPKEKAYQKMGKAFYPPAAPKFLGNNKDGCFSKFTQWQPEPYITLKEASDLLVKRSKYNGVFRPQSGLKTYYTLSVVNNKIDITCNKRTWRTMKPITYPQFNL